MTPLSQFDMNDGCCPECGSEKTGWNGPWLECLDCAIRWAPDPAELGDRLADLVLDRLNRLDPEERAVAARRLRSAMAAEAAVEIVDE